MRATAAKKDAITNAHSDFVANTPPTPAITAPDMNTIHPMITLTFTHSPNLKVFPSIHVPYAPVAIRD